MLQRHLRTNKELIISASAHIVIVLVIMLSNGFRPFRPLLLLNTRGLKTASITVDVVGLPNILKKDLTRFNESGRTAEMVFNETQKLARDKSNFIQQLRKSLAQKEDSYLKKIKVIKGLKIEQASDGTGNGQDSSPYFIGVKELVRNYWKIPTWVDTSGLNTLITIKIDINGALSEITISKSSGNEDFDRMSYQAVKNAAPFTPPPPEVQGLLKNGVVLSFP